MTELPTSKNAAADGEVVGYMCLIAWEYEIGAAANGNRVFPSVDTLIKAHDCAEDCGIVEVGIRVRRVVCEGKEE